MAKMIEQRISFTVSKMFKTDESAPYPLQQEQLASLEEVITELAGAGCLVEMITDPKK